MTKILGLDLGTNSIGWAVVENEDIEKFKLLEKGVHIFQEGVKIEKGIEGSKAEERTKYRSARRLKFRRKLRKINTLRVLSKYNFCPSLSDEELNTWRFKKIYPSNEKFRLWYLTDDSLNKNPYFFRNLVASERLDLAINENREKIGRAFYHLAQRRGFLSNRLESTKESDGEIKKAIAELTEKKGSKTIGQYFNEKYINGEKIRDQYTHREAHYLEEFNRICEVQQLNPELINELKKAIFYQRPLKSQKGLIGKCPFENNKPRCNVSHPLFEEYRMLCFINNIKIKTPDDDKLRFLNDEERNKIKPLFYRKSKDYFDFDDIAKQLAPKNQYKFYKSVNIYPEDYLFNFSMKTTVSGCPISARFESVFGDNWNELKIEYYREKDGKKSTIDINDVWHVLFTYDNEDKLIHFAKNRLGFDEEKLKEFQRIHLKNEYGSLSLKAIKKILPYLRKGLIYSHAVFLANMEKAVPDEIWRIDENKEIIQKEIFEIIQTQNNEKRIVDTVNGLIKNCRKNNWFLSDESENHFKKDIHASIISVFGKSIWGNIENEKQQKILEETFSLFKKQISKNLGKGEFLQIETIDERVKEFLTDHFEINNGSLENLYHPSAIEIFKQPKREEDGKRYLGSPMVSSVRNPMAMRALHQLRKLINELLKQDVIDENTKINIEMSRDLKNANERKALQSWQRDRENLHKEYSMRIQEHFSKAGINREPSETDILKYQLWEEQDHKCIYTGNNIGISDFLGNNPSFDIEHTIPLSFSFDNSQQNKTLCQNRFNREIKRNKIPFELANHNEILSRIDKWKEKYEELNKQIEIQVKRSKAAATKESKDSAIQRRHKLAAERDYWKGKYERFTMEEVSSGFKNSQIVDIGIITKYARIYLNTLFDKVYTVKGNTVADFRKIWGLQDEYAKKARTNHVHHCIDAITIACMTKENYEALAKFYHDSEEMFIARIDKKPHVEKPWPTFTEDVKEIEKEIFISHYTPDNLPVQSKKKLRKRGKIQKNEKGDVIYQKGDTVRGSLHKETFYGAIKRETTNKEGEKEEKIFFVVRQPIDSLSANDINNIVDEVVREKVRKAIEEKGLKQALSEPIWMNEEKKIPIKKVRCYTPSVTNPIHLKKHRDISTHEHKKSYHVTNDGNYLMAIYEGKDAKGKTKRDFEIINNLQAGGILKQSVKSVLKAQGIICHEEMFPNIKENGKSILRLKYVLKTGLLLMFWINSPEEIWDLEKDQKYKRLFKITQFESDGRIQARFHQIAKPDNELLKVSELNFSSVIEKIRLSKANLNMLVEGYDFKINILGQIEKIN
ncbi:MAG: HNH endonuclease domain-containing protein [Bacteroidales bacterium]|jgi:CRISPR-associated endonuclease Csn1|nr:HNH endonuclease domain-containing protein [Bacteroidales bacterium]